MLWAIVVSLAGPIDKAMLYFNIITVIFSMMTISTLIGIMISLAGQGLTPLSKILVCPDGPKDPKCHFENVVVDGKDKREFSLLTLSGIIMMSVYFLPMMLRPVDFVMHFRGYVIGMLTYILMLPTFINIMTIYSMCNLHDISWGNRPSVAAGAAGANQFTENAKK